MPPSQNKLSPSSHHKYTYSIRKFFHPPAEKAPHRKRCGALVCFFNREEYHLPFRAGRIPEGNRLRNAAVVVEWEGTALPRFCGRFAPTPLRTVLTPFDVHGSPLLFRFTKLFCRESSCDNPRKLLMFYAVWRS